MSYCEIDAIPELLVKDLKANFILKNYDEINLQTFII